MGSHGAGAAGVAGVAMRGVGANTWRDDPAFRRAMAAPAGSPDRRGRWAGYGTAGGFQRGRLGCSYANETIDRPGQFRSTPLRSSTSS